MTLNMDNNHAAEDEMVNHKRSDTEWATLEIMDNGILIVRYKDGVLLTEDVARAILDAHIGLCGPDPIPVLVCLDRIKGMTRGARVFFARGDENPAVTTQVAMLVSSPIGRVVANFFMGLSKTRVPTRSFTDEAKALSWLQERRSV